MPETFVHAHASHCESGVMSSLLSHNGLPISEAMAFGLASALSFAYLPFIRINGLPLVAYRMPPRAIIRGLARSLGLDMRFETFRSRSAGMERLDVLLASGTLVGLQTSVFWLPYFPPDLRFHFNGHNLLVYGREGGEYLISDPVGETTVRCARADLEKARFAKGALAPKGLLYYVAAPPVAPDWARLGRRALARTARIMLAPFPLVGVRGMRMLANRVERLPLADGGESARLYIGNIVRMQEEIGTGGGGFRFLYAAFLQELAARTGYTALEGLASRLVEIGDRWREFALAAARMIRGRDALSTPALAERLRALAADEKLFFQNLNRAQRAWAR
ncbi:MAG TPA: BtrH N-terminal domain-containing protein [Burkholderiales bacterium]